MPPILLQILINTIKPPSYMCAVVLFYSSSLLNFQIGIPKSLNNTLYYKRFHMRISFNSTHWKAFIHSILLYMTYVCFTIFLEFSPGSFGQWVPWWWVITWILHRFQRLVHELRDEDVQYFRRMDPDMYIVSWSDRDLGFTASQHAREQVEAVFNSRPQVDHCTS